MRSSLGLAGVLALVAIASGCGSGSTEGARTGWQAVSDWMHGVAFDAGGEVHLPTLTPPTDSELREASSVGYGAGKEADGSAEELAQKERIDVDEVKVVYCEFFAGYLEDGEEETVASWLDDHFRTPPEKFEATRVDLEQISESTDSLPEKALETASVTVCAN